MSSTVSRGSSAPARQINVVCAADDNYAMALGVTLLSASSSLSEGWKIRLFLLDGGLSAASWAALSETLADEPIETTAIRPDPSLVRSLSISHHITHVAYYRLLTAELLPSDITRALYLDADLLVLADLAEIWQLPLEGRSCLASVDIACPFVDARLGCRNLKRSYPYLNSARPIPNYRALGMDGAREYFNSGVMSLDLDRWRRNHVADRLLECLHDNAGHVWCWDQYALNVVLADEWGRLPPRWNQGTHIFKYPSEKNSPIAIAEFVSMRDQPAIVHFTTEWKPWHYRNSHPLRQRFFEFLDQTAWSGWRPSRPNFSPQRWWQQQASAVQRRVALSYRELAARWV